MVHNRIHKNQLTVPILSQVSKSIIPSHFLKIYFNVILPMTHRPSKCSPSLRFPYQNPVRTSPLPHVCYIPLQSHSSSFDHPNNIWWGEYRSLCFSLCSLLHSPVTPFLWYTSTTLFSNTLSLCFSLNMSYQILHPYRQPFYKMI